MTIIAHHDCRHLAQDDLHGQHQRVFNSTAAQDGFRCTVCGREKTVQGAKR